MKRAAYIALTLGTIAALALGFKREAFGKRHCYTLEAFRYRQARLFGIPVYRKTTQHEVGYIAEYQEIASSNPAEEHWHIGRPDWVWTILKERAPGYGTRWEVRQRHEILKQIYERYRATGLIEDARSNLRAIDALIPVLESIDSLDFEALDSLRIRLGLPSISQSNEKGA